MLNSPQLIIVLQLRKSTPIIRRKKLVSDGSENTILICIRICRQRENTCKSRWGKMEIKFDSEERAHKSSGSIFKTFSLISKWFPNNNRKSGAIYPQEESPALPRQWATQTPRACRSLGICCVSSAGWRQAGPEGIAFLPPAQRFYLFQGVSFD